jgi:hypothetical protein
MNRVSRRTKLVNERKESGCLPLRVVKQQYLRARGVALIPEDDHPDEEESCAEHHSGGLHEPCVPEREPACAPASGAPCP